MIKKSTLLNKINKGKMKKIKLIIIIIINQWINNKLIIDINKQISKQKTHKILMIKSNSNSNSNMKYQLMKKKKILIGKIKTRINPNFNKWNKAY